MVGALIGTARGFFTTLGAAHLGAVGVAPDFLGLVLQLVGDLCVLSLVLAVLFRFFLCFFVFFQGLRGLVDGRSGHGLEMGFLTLVLALLDRHGLDLLLGGGVLNGELL